MAEKQGYVYILRLTGDKWYVGYTEDPQVRICSHFLGAGARWTQTHKPVEVESIRPGTTLLETCVTLAMMVQKGGQNVRGGSYTQCAMEKPPACLGKAQHYASYKVPAATEEVEEEADAPA